MTSALSTHKFSFFRRRCFYIHRFADDQYRALKLAITQVGGSVWDLKELSTLDKGETPMAQLDWVILEPFQPEIIQLPKQVLKQLSHPREPAKDPKVVTLYWLERCLYHCKIVARGDRPWDIPTNNLLEVQQNHKISSSGLLPVDIEHLKRIVNKAGGSYKKYLTVNCTHLITPSFQLDSKFLPVYHYRPPARDKIEYAQRNGVSILSIEEFWLSLFVQQEDSNTTNFIVPQKQCEPLKSLGISDEEIRSRHINGTQNYFAMPHCSSRGFLSDKYENEDQSILSIGMDSRVEINDISLAQSLGDFEELPPSSGVRKEQSSISHLHKTGNLTTESPLIRLHPNEIEGFINASEHQNTLMELDDFSRMSSAQPPLSPDLFVPNSQQLQDEAYSVDRETEKSMFVEPDNTSLVGGLFTGLKTTAWKADTSKELCTPIVLRFKKSNREKTPQDSTTITEIDTPTKGSIELLKRQTSDLIAQLDETRVQPRLRTGLRRSKSSIRLSHEIKKKQLETPLFSSQHQHEEFAPESSFQIHYQDPEAEKLRQMILGNNFDARLEERAATVHMDDRRPRQSKVYASASKRARKRQAVDVDMESPSGSSVIVVDKRKTRARKK